MGHDQFRLAVLLRGLGHDGHVTHPATPDRGQRAQAGILFGRHGHQHHAPGEITRAADKRFKCFQRRHHAGFHVTGAAAIKPVILDLASEGLVGPLVIVAGGHDIHMPGEHHGRARALAADHAGHAGHPGALDLVAGISGIGNHLADTVEPVIHLGAGFGQPVGDTPNGGFFIAGNRGNTHEIDETLPQARLVDKLVSVSHVLTR